MVTKTLAERLCKVAPERFAFSVVGNGWYAPFSLIEHDSKYDRSLANHLKQFEDIILYASAWALNEMRTTQKNSPAQAVWLGQNLFSVPVINLTPVRILELFCEWKEMFEEKE
jgi:hypothetical protein